MTKRVKVRVHVAISCAQLITTCTLTIIHFRNVTNNSRDSLIQTFRAKTEARCSSYIQGKIYTGKLYATK